MKLSIARVSVSSCTRHTCSSNSLREDDAALVQHQVAQQVALHQREANRLVWGGEQQRSKVYGAAGKGKARSSTAAARRLGGRCRQRGRNHAMRRSKPFSRASRIESSKGLER